MQKSPRLIVIVKQRPFDEAVWKRLLVAYAYAIYDRRRKSVEPAVTAGEGARP